MTGLNEARWGIEYWAKVYKLGYDADEGVYCEELAFCAIYATFRRAREAMNSLDALCAHIEPGGSLFTTAVVVEYDLEAGIESEPLGEWCFCSHKVKKIGKSPAQLREVVSVIQSEDEA